MSIGGILESLQQGLTGSTGRFLAFGADGDFSSTLTLGQIIKGKVMRHYEGGRYGIDFNGQEKVVDSTFPMNNGDVIYARVIGVDEKVHLQRVIADHAKPSSQELSRDSTPSQYGVNEYRESISQLFDQYQAKLTSEEYRIIEQLQNALGGSRHVAVSALILSKLGIAIDSGLIKAVHRVLADLSSDKRMNVNQPAAFSVAESAGMPMERMVDGLTALLCSVAADGILEHLKNPENGIRNEGGTRRSDLQNFLPHSDSGHAGDKEHLEWFLGQWLLNAQTGGAVSHRFMRLPLWFGDQLIEVTLALFAQKRGAEERDGGEPVALHYRSVVFSLDTESLGHIEIQAKLADQHVQIDVTSENHAAAEYLGSHMTSLKSVVASHGWQIDDIRYGVKNDPKGPIQAVVEHLITQDSLNRLM